MNAKTTILACVLNLNKKKRGSREISPAGGRFKTHFARYKDIWMHKPDE